MASSNDKPQIQMAGATHIGRVRGSNQDNFLIADMRRLLNVCDSSLIDLDGRSLVADQPGELLMVADGMGGYTHGALASQTAIRHMAAHVSNLMEDFLVIDPDDDASFRNALLDAPMVIHRRLEVEGRLDPDKAEMGTTLTAAYITWPLCYVLHVGDSRCYLARDGELEQLTRDQTVAQAMMDAGMTEEEIVSPTWFHMLHSCLAASETVPAPQLERRELLPGDTLLLCSDGLNRHVSDAEVLEVLKSDASVSDKCEQLIRMTNDGGGRDNVTVVIAEFEGEPSAADACDVRDGFEMLSAFADTAIGE